MRVKIFLVSSIMFLGFFSGCLHLDGELRADFNYNPKNPMVGEEVHFVANSKGEDVTRWLWNFGDGNSSNSSEVVHVYQSNGSYNVSLTVWSSEGESSTYSEKIVVDPMPNYAPSKPLVSNYSFSSKEPFLFYLFNVSSTDSNGDEIRYEVEWGDGNSSVSYMEESGSVYRFRYAWEKPGVYNVKVRAVDKHGSRSNWSSINVSIDEQSLAPDFVVPTVDYGDISLSDYRGNVVLLEFSMVGCGACNWEIDDFKKIKEDLDEQIKIISVYLNDIENVSKMKAKYDAEWIFGIDENESVAKKYASQWPLVPTLFIIDKEGFISYSNSGYMDNSTLLKKINKII